jgi:hypothetical protein
MQGELPDVWKSVKEVIVGYCSELGLEHTKRYIDETLWSYLVRLGDLSKLKNIPEELVIKK